MSKNIWRIKHYKCSVHIRSRLTTLCSSGSFTCRSTTSFERLHWCAIERDKVSSLFVCWHDELYDIDSTLSICVCTTMPRPNTVSSDQGRQHYYLSGERIWSRPPYHILDLNRGAQARSCLDKGTEFLWGKQEVLIFNIITIPTSTLERFESLPPQPPRLNELLPVQSNPALWMLLFLFASNEHRLVPNLPITTRRITSLIYSFVVLYVGGLHNSICISRPLRSAVMPKVKKQ